MEIGNLLYEGKAKKVFETSDPDVVMVSYKDDATAFNGEKKGTIVGKGAINNRMTNHILALLEKRGVPTHLIKEINDRETYVKKVSIVPAASSASAVLSRRATALSSSVPRPFKRLTSSSQLGGTRNISRASGTFRLTCRAPCRSISRITFRPSATARTTSARGVP